MNNNSKKSISLLNLSILIVSTTMIILLFCTDYLNKSPIISLHYLFTLLLIGYIFSQIWSYVNSYLHPHQNIIHNLDQITTLRYPKNNISNFQDLVLRQTALKNNIQYKNRSNRYKYRQNYPVNADIYQTLTNTRDSNSKQQIQKYFSEPQYQSIIHKIKISLKLSSLLENQQLEKQIYLQVNYPNLLKNYNILKLINFISINIRQILQISILINIQDKIKYLNRLVQKNFGYQLTANALDRTTTLSQLRYSLFNVYHSQKCLPKKFFNQNQANIERLSKDLQQIQKILNQIPDITPKNYLKIAIYSMALANQFSTQTFIILAQKKGQFQINYQNCGYAKNKSSRNIIRQQPDNSNTHIFTVHADQRVTYNKYPDYKTKYIEILISLFLINLQKKTSKKSKLFNYLNYKLKDRN